MTVVLQGAMFAGMAYALRGAYQGRLSGILSGCTVMGLALIVAVVLR